MSDKLDKTSSNDTRIIPFSAIISALSQLFNLASLESTCAMQLPKHKTLTKEPHALKHLKTKTHQKK